jgi:hypothetical protein
MQLTAGSTIRTDVPCRSDDNQKPIPAGSTGVVREVFTDPLGGYRVELRIDDKTIQTATLYPYQFTVIEQESN